MTAYAGRLARAQALLSTPPARFVRELSAWVFGVIAPILCFGVAFSSGMFRSWGVVVLGYAACSIVAYVASRFLRGGRRPVLDSLVAGTLVGAFVLSLILVFWLSFGRVFVFSWTLLFTRNPLPMAFGALGLAALPGSLAYGIAARRALMSASRTAPCIAGCFAPLLLLFTVQCAVWREVEERTREILAAVDAGVPVDEIDISGLRVLGRFSDWPGLDPEMPVANKPWTGPDPRIAALNGRLVQLTTVRWGH